MHNIFSTFIKRYDEIKIDEQKRLAYAYWFIESFPAREFEKEEKIMYYVLSYAIALGTLLTEKNITNILKTEVKSMILKENIKVSGTELLSFDDVNHVETMVRITEDLVMQNFYELQNSISELDDFPSTANEFMQNKLEERLFQVYNDSSEMIGSLHKKKIGARDALEYTLQKVSELNEIYSKENLEDITDSSIDNQDFEYVCKTGIPAIDMDMVAVYTRQLIVVAAAGGVGKTRLTLGNIIYQAAVLEDVKKNCLFIAIEQTKGEVESMLTARHILTLYGKQIEDKAIYTNTVDDKYKTMVEVAKYDLFESGKYGKIVIKDKSILYLNNFIDKIKVWDSLKGPFQLICIDYMGLIEDSTVAFSKTLLKHEIINRATLLFKRYCKKFNKAGIAICQLGSTGNKNSKADKEIQLEDIEGGMGTGRHADYVLTMSATPEQEAQMKRKIGTPKKRSSAGFKSILIDCRPGCCYFYQNINRII